MLTWSTDRYRTEDRFDVWHDTLNATHLPWRLNKANERFCRAEIQALDTGVTTFVTCRCDPCAGFRDAKMARADSGDFYGILALQKGRERVRQDNWSVEMRPGDVLIWDSARPIRFDVLESIEKATLLVPKHRLAEVAGTPVLPSGRVNTTQGFGALLFDRMRGVSNQISDFATVGTPQLELALLRDVLNAVGDMRSNEMVSARQALRERVERVIEARFQDQDFAPAVLADMLGISVRALNKAFENSGTTVAMKIRERRLHAAKTDLGNPDLLRCSVTQICLTRGFSSVEHFSRSFRARFGISPRDYRSQACAERSKAV
ncbi:helix-turn-helix domain-containing protein [Pseudooceanicola lipolyticus]|uniref:helix-turn-helix domain-containing protein n=1 Tax=Pseudooceanicola lipolyticus TaxID=2029104 RepID=UPI00155ECF6B|nr:helix-turn-helix domain-containing protein [Pseudooceanicola lipolyticus]